MEAAHLPERRGRGEQDRKTPGRETDRQTIRQLGKTGQPDTITAQIDQPGEARRKGPFLPYEHHAGAERDA